MAETPTTQSLTIEVPVGIVGDGHHDLKTESRKVEANEPPALAPNSELKQIGKPVPRLDGKLKVTGGAKYTADIKLPGMLYAQLVTSSAAHARIKSIDTSDAEKFPGVKAVHVLDRLANNGPATRPAEGPRVRFVGQPIAAVAADTQWNANEAARLVHIEYEELPWVIDVEKARQPDAPKLFEAPVETAGTAGGGGAARGLPQKGNVRGPNINGNARDTIEQGIKDADVVVEAEYHTQVQTHSALETHGVVADWKEEGLTIYISTQATNGVRDQMATAFKLPTSKVRVICEYMGGGFGAKFPADFYTSLATNLSKKAGAPVRLMLTRRDEHLSVGNRPSSWQKYRIGAKKDGTLTAIHLVNYGTGGIGGGAGAGRPASGMYPVPHLLTEEYDVFTNGGPACAMRAPGHPQGAFGFEQTIDELADRLGMDPLALREKIDTGERSDVRRVERKIGAERIGWSNRKRPGIDAGPIKRGIGMAQGMWSRGGGRGSCEVRISKDGSVEVLSSVQDIGTGIRTVLGQVVAEELGLDAHDIHVKIGDTNFPAGVASGGSTTTPSMTPAARDAAYEAKRQLLAVVASGAGVPADALDLVDGMVRVKDGSRTICSFKAAAAKIPGDDIAARATRRADWKSDNKNSGAPGGVQFAQVAVDTETGVIKVERIVAVHDCGRPMNTLTATSQINGAVIQGLSYALFENRLLDRQTAIMVNSNLEQYKIAGAKEIPQIEAILVEQYVGKSSTDAAGLAEPAIVATPAAIANAVYNAIGVRIRQLPMTPARVLAALAAKTATAEGSAHA